jgi:hypothetical protein
VRFAGSLGDAAGPVQWVRLKTTMMLMMMLPAAHMRCPTPRLVRRCPSAVPGRLSWVGGCPSAAGTAASLSLPVAAAAAMTMWAAAAAAQTSHQPWAAGGDGSTQEPLEPLLAEGAEDPRCRSSGSVLVICAAAAAALPLALSLLLSPREEREQPPVGLGDSLRVGRPAMLSSDPEPVLQEEEHLGFGE